MGYQDFKSEEEKAKLESGTKPGRGALEKLLTRINRLELSKSAEEYYNQGEILLARSEFDDAIEEFVKVIQISSPQEKWYLSAEKALKEMGFSEADVQQVQIAAVMDGTNPEETIQTALLPFWNNRKQKLRSIFYIAVATFLLTLPWSLAVVLFFPLLFFPVGLTGWATNFNFKGVYLLASLLLWIPYFGMATVIVRSNNKKLVVIMYIILIFLLLLNVVGCQIGAPKAASDIQ